MAAAVKNDSDEQPVEPASYDEAYPGRFLKAGNLHGKTIVFRIVKVERRTLKGIDGEKRETTITLENGGKEFQVVAPKINGFCLREMFGPEIANWKGKRVALYPTDKYMPMNGEECIRVFGSPDIEKDVEVSYVVPRRKNPVRMTMKAMRAERGRQGQGNAPPTPPPAESSGTGSLPREPGADG